MAPDNPVIPMRMRRELDRLRAAVALTVVSSGQEQRLDPKVGNSIDRILQASELIKSKSAELDGAKRQISELRLSNSQLASRCAQANVTLKELKDQLYDQISRAEAAEALVLRLEHQLRAAENAKRETEFNLSRLTEFIEQSLPIVKPVPVPEPSPDTASVA